MIFTGIISLVLITAFPVWHVWYALGLQFFKLNFQYVISIEYFVDQHALSDIITAYGNKIFHAFCHHQWRYQRMANGSQFKKLEWLFLKSTNLFVVLSNTDFDK